MAGFTRGTFNWVDLSAHDMDAAIDWYAKYFGWEARKEDTQGGPPYAQFLVDGEKVAGVGQMPDAMKGQMPPVWNSYVCVEDCAADEARAKELGAETIFPTMQVMDHGSMCFIKDPTGAALGFWQPGEHEGAERYNQPNSFSWNELATRDLGAAKQFYGELLGWTFEAIEGPSPMEMIKNGEAMNGHMLQTNEQWEGLPPMWTVYFTVDDCDAMAKKAVELGGKVMVEPFDIAPGRIAVVADAQGASFYIIQMREG